MNSLLPKSLIPRAFGEDCDGCHLLAHFAAILVAGVILSPRPAKLRKDRLSLRTSRLIKAFCLQIQEWWRREKQASYALLRQLREVEQQFTEFEWQLTRLEPEEFARQW